MLSSGLIPDVIAVGQKDDYPALEAGSCKGGYSLLGSQNGAKRLVVSQQGEPPLIQIGMKPLNPKDYGEGLLHYLGIIDLTGGQGV